MRIHWGAANTPNVVVYYGERMTANVTSAVGCSSDLESNTCHIFRPHRGHRPLVEIDYRIISSYWLAAQLSESESPSLAEDLY